MGFRVNSAKSSQKKTKKKRAAPPPKKATAHKSIAQSGTIKPSLSCEGGHVHFFFHDWGKHNAGEEKKQSAKTIDSLGFLYVPPSVCEMSTKAEQCKYGGVFWVPVCAFFSPPVLSWWGREGGGDLQAGNVISFFFFFFDLEPRKKKKSVWRGAVLGDETAVSVAGCNTSSHCRGWLEGLRAHGEPPSTRFYMCICVFLGHDERGRSFHSVVTLCIYILFLFIPFWLTWLREVRAGKKKRGVLLDSRSTWVGDFFTGEYGGVRLIMMRDWSHRAPSPFPLVAF